jgi:acetyl-CoA carboxylase biotin carboxyl carrier protein
MTTDKGAGNGTMQVDTKLVRQLAKMLDDTNLSEIEVEDGGRRIKVARKLAGSVAVAPAPVAAAPAPAATAPAAAPAAAPAVSEDHPGAVKSPMVGTVYLAPEPEADNFVKPGDSVSEGDTLVIIEAMKVMNPITAPRSGTLKSLLVENAEPVEFDQPLAIVE